VTNGQIDVRPRYSLVIPVFNEAEVLPELFRQLQEFLDGLEGTVEVVLVDDGSRDSSLLQMTEQARSDRRYVVVPLSRNFGHQVAISAGLDHARGDAVVMLDADLQDPLRTVPEMIALWQEGYKVVYGVRADRSLDRRLRRSKSAFYWLINRLSDVDVPRDVGDFRLMDRVVVDALTRMPERNLYLRGMTSWVGFQQIGVPYKRDPRFAGKSKYTLRRMVGLAWNGIVSCSTAPLKLALIVGFVVSGASLSLAFAVLVARIFGAYPVPGWASSTVIVCLLGGVQLVILGVMGEYIARISNEVRARPLYFVRGVTARRMASDGAIVESDVPHSLI
jgi:polyisoprenyl-phosphate glycosyltransferase